MKRKVLKFFASLRLAIIIIIGIGIVTAVGTVVESRYDLHIANKLVYQTLWMYSLLFLLCLNLIGVMVDRWPWKKRHTGFVCAHIGIILIIFGSVVTRIFGIDGTMVLAIGERGSRVALPETEIVVFLTLPGVDSFRMIHRESVDFFMQPPERRPVVVDLPDGTLEVLDYKPFALRQNRIVPSERKTAGGAISLQLDGRNAQFVDWLFQAGVGQKAIRDLGPSQVAFLTRGASLSREEAGLEGDNLALFRPSDAIDGKLDYVLYAGGEIFDKGVIGAGESLDTGWMDFRLRILRYLPKARERISFDELDRPTPKTQEAIAIRFNDDTEWMSLNSTVRFFSDQAGYLVQYRQVLVPLGFEVELKEFRVGRYPGVSRAMEYESLVEVPGEGEHLIYMNNPLDTRGFRIYQAAFHEDEDGNPTHSVFAVNRDPGLWVKYLGSIIMVLGIIHLFYWKTLRKGGPNG